MILLPTGRITRVCAPIVCVLVLLPTYALPMLQRLVKVNAVPCLFHCPIISCSARLHYNVTHLSVGSRAEADEVFGTRGSECGNFGASP